MPETATAMNAVRPSYPGAAWVQPPHVENWVQVVMPRYRVLETWLQR